MRIYHVQARTRGHRITGLTDSGGHVNQRTLGTDDQSNHEGSSGEARAEATTTPPETCHLSSTDRDGFPSHIFSLSPMANALGSHKLFEQIPRFWQLAKAANNLYDSVEPDPQLGGNGQWEEPLSSLEVTYWSPCRKHLGAEMPPLHPDWTVLSRGMEHSQ